MSSGAVSVEVFPPVYYSVCWEDLVDFLFSRVYTMGIFVWV